MKCNICGRYIGSGDEACAPIHHRKLSAAETELPKSKAVQGSGDVLAMFFTNPTDISGANPVHDEYQCRILMHLERTIFAHARHGDDFICFVDGGRVAINIEEVEAQDADGKPHRGKVVWFDWMPSSCTATYRFWMNLSSVRHLGAAILPTTRMDWTFAMCHEPAFSEAGFDLLHAKEVA